MATTKFLNSSKTVWATTYSGGMDGRKIDISMKLDDETQATATFTETELRAMLMAYGDVVGLAVPSADDEGSIKAQYPDVDWASHGFPNFEKALTEFKENLKIKKAD